MSEKRIFNIQVEIDVDELTDAANFDNEDFDGDIIAALKTEMNWLAEAGIKVLEITERVVTKTDIVQ